VIELVYAKIIHTYATAQQFSGMGWLRLVGSLKLSVSFAKEPYKRDYILQKRPVILRSLLIVATPYVDILSVSDLFEPPAEWRGDEFPTKLQFW